VEHFCVRLVILAAAFLRYREDRQTDKHWWKSYHQTSTMTAVGVDMIIITDFVKACEIMAHVGETDEQQSG